MVLTVAGVIAIAAVLARHRLALGSRSPLDCSPPSASRRRTCCPMGARQRRVSGQWRRRALVGGGLGRDRRRDRARGGRGRHATAPFGLARSRCMTPARFRELFPALRSMLWLDTPGAAPGAEPVVQAQREALSAWASGEFDRAAWDSATGEARALFARLVGVDPMTVSTLGSLAEAAATVAGSLPAGRIVVAAEEFRSNLFPVAGAGAPAPRPPHGRGWASNQVASIPTPSINPTLLKESPWNSGHSAARLRGRLARRRPRRRRPAAMASRWWKRRIWRVTAKWP
jgi:hypothetical protein